MFGTGEANFIPNDVTAIDTTLPQQLQDMETRVDVSVQNSVISDR